MRQCIMGDCEEPAYAKYMCERHYAGQRTKVTRPRKSNMRRGSLLVFIENAIASSTDDCIIWPFFRRSKGYPNARLDGVHRDVHRYVCVRTHGEPSDPKLVAGHSCHNKGCINPRHLSWITHQQNIIDSWKVRKAANELRTQR